MRQENGTFCAPLTKIVTSHVGLLLIQYLNQMSFRRYGQNQVKLGTLMKQDEKNSKISNILLPWQLSRFEPSLIRNTIISFSTPQ